MKRIKMTLDTDSINKTIEYLKRYGDSLDYKCQRFIKRLTDEGIQVGKSLTMYDSDMGDTSTLVLFYAELSPSKNGCSGILFAVDRQKIVRQWIGMDKDAQGLPTGVMYVKTAEVSPILMYEFGSGYNAVPGQDRDGLIYPSFSNSPQGSFPNQEHAFDSGGWNWRDLQGEWHHSNGITPTQPMYNAWKTMYEKIKTIAKEVFMED